MDALVLAKSCFLIPTHGIESGRELNDKCEENQAQAPCNRRRYKHARTRDENTASMTKSDGPSQAILEVFLSWDGLIMVKASHGEVGRVL